VKAREGRLRAKWRSIFPDPALLVDDFERVGPQHRRRALCEGRMQLRERNDQKREVHQGQADDKPLGLHGVPPSLLRDVDGAPCVP
jgi:hypothetical protein